MEKIIHMNKETVATKMENTTPIKAPPIYEKHSEPELQELLL